VRPTLGLGRLDQLDVIGECLDGGLGHHDVQAALHRRHCDLEVSAADGKRAAWV